MTPATSTIYANSISLTDSFERYLQDKGKGRGGDGGNYRRNAARELERFGRWAAGDCGRSEWTGIVPDDIDREPTSRISMNEYSGHMPDTSAVTARSSKTPARVLAKDECQPSVIYGYTDDTDELHIQELSRSGYGEPGPSPGDVIERESTKFTLDDGLPELATPPQGGFSLSTDDPLGE